MPLGLIAKKLGHTRVYDAQGVMWPVTILLAGPNHVLQVKTQGVDGYNAVQLGFDPQKESRLTKPLAGHLRKFSGTDKVLAVKKIKEFRDFSKELKTGETIGPSLFMVGDFVDLIGVTKGRGFEGVVGRWSFAGGDSTHGAKGWHRRSGAIGCRLFPGHVRRGLKMPGHMGQARRTAQNLEIIQVLDADNILLVKGSCPGSEGDYIIVREAKKLSREMVAKRRVAEEARKKAAPSKAKPGSKPAEAKAAAPAKK